jgi:hypothetical protein
MTLGGFSAHAYEANTLDAQLAVLREGGVEWIALTPRGFQRTRTSTEIALDPDLSPTPESVRRALRAARGAGLHVLLKPQIDLLGDGWRGEITFTSEADWERWFASYRRFLEGWADVAREEGAEILCVGTELDGTRHREADWRALIAIVRGRFEGRLTWAANFDRERDIRFWDALDDAGVDAYFPLAETEEPSDDALRARWREIAGELGAWSRRIGRPVLFTEIGYRSVAHAAREPGEWQRQGPVALELQARLYRATFAALWDEPWLAGLYWWGWLPTPVGDATRDADYTPQGKPAWRVTKEWYARPHAAPTAR